jgi:thiamine pyrophosphokinase
MMQAVIIANGKMEKPEFLSTYLNSSSWIIAADGGTYNCISLGLRPNVIIGDLDSLKDEELTSYREAGTEIIAYPKHKDETDLELALQYALKIGITDLLIIGGLGARWDMSIANIMVLAHPMYTDLNIRLLDGHQEIRLLKAGDRTIIHGQPGEAISLIPLAGDVLGISTRGLEYPLNNETLQFGSARGVSNVFILEQAEIFFSQGLLCCITNRVDNLSGF